MKKLCGFSTVWADRADLGSTKTAEQKLKYATFEASFFMFSWAKNDFKKIKKNPSVHNEKLKVSKFRKQIVLYSFEPKTKRNISALRDRSLGQKYFVRFLVQMRTSQFAFEIY